jgi:enoyl-CoA hydratase
MEFRKIIVDVPRPKVQRITLNRPDKRNPLSNELRGELFYALEAADNDRNIAVTIMRGAGGCFSAGYDLKSNVAQGQPFHTAAGIGNWPRHVVEGFSKMWDLAKPVIAQVHGYALQAAPNSRPRATSCTSPRTRRSVIRSCARSARRTTSSIRGSWECDARWS